MKNPLLKRQIDKYLDQQDYVGLEKFLSVVNESYYNYEDQIHMLQRAIKLSSDELFEANHRLRDEAISLKEANNFLKSVLASMHMNISAEEGTELTTAEYIRKQSTQIIEINQQREKLLKDLEVQNEELNEYAHMVSHDLKAPLRNINTLISWITEDYKDILNEQAQKSFGLIQFNLEKMDLLINGILDYSSIDKMESENRDIDFAQVLDEVSRTIMLPENFELNIVSKMPCLFGNFYRFRQLFQNLIENAIKYNDKEKGYIEVGCSDKGDFVEFYIKDNGKGIAEAYFDKIFKVFTKLESNTHSSGIGLSTVKKIINFYGGTIWVESTENVGTTFFFTLPKKHGKA